MSVPVISFPPGSLARLGLTAHENVHYQSTPDELVQDTLRIGEGTLTSTGALAIRTGQFTGRSPQDRFFVKDKHTEGMLNWNNFNLPIEEKHFLTVRRRLIDYLNKKMEFWVRDGYVCADQRYRLNVRLICEKPWTSLFAHNMFLRPDDHELEDFEPDWRVIVASDLKLNPAECGTRQQNAVIISFQHKTVLIAGTGYTGEVKKSIFTVLNFLLPTQHDVLPMHCSANAGDEGDTAIFFGLSGTGKTTLSADPTRELIGDDEHGWTDDNVFNFEGGCYAKLFNLSEEKEPEIFAAIRPGAMVENIQFYPGTSLINFDDKSITENTRVSYPLHYIPNAAEPAVGSLPKNIFFLTCDAYGVLPPISKLTKAQAMYQFISGYTAKIAGTEAGVTEPRPTFSACFGEPFMPLHPGHYAAMLGRKMEEHNVHVWLINTGWTGGPYGVGSRMKLSYTRAMIGAVLKGELNDAEMSQDSVFGLAIPRHVPNVPDYLLQPRDAWINKTAYDEKAKFLAKLFVENFRKYDGGVAKEVLTATPNV